MTTVDRAAFLCVGIGACLIAVSCLVSLMRGLYVGAEARKIALLGLLMALAGGTILRSVLHGGRP